MPGTKSLRNEVSEPDSVGSVDSAVEISSTAVPEIILSSNSAIERLRRRTTIKPTRISNTASAVPSIVIQLLVMKSMAESIKLFSSAGAAGLTRVLDAFLSATGGFSATAGCLTSAFLTSGAGAATGATSGADGAVIPGVVSTTVSGDASVAIGGSSAVPDTDKVSASVAESSASSATSIGTTGLTSPACSAACKRARSAFCISISLLALSICCSSRATLSLRSCFSSSEEARDSSSIPTFSLYVLIAASYSARSAALAPDPAESVASTFARTISSTSCSLELLSASTVNAISASSFSADGALLSVSGSAADISGPASAVSAFATLLGEERLPWYSCHSSICARSSCCAADGEVDAISLSEGICSVWPTRIRFMLFFMKAFGFCLKMAIITCAILMLVSALTSSAMLQSTSPFWTGPYVPPGRKSE